MSLSDGVAAFLPTEFRATRIVQVYITEVAQRHILYRQLVNVHVEHREVADSPLHLSALSGEHHILWSLGQSDEVKFLGTNDNAKWLSPVFAFDSLKWATASRKSLKTKGWA